MADEQVLNAARKYAEAVREIMPVDKIILYGSQVRGTATRDSDIDIAVVMRALPEDYLSVAASLWTLTRKIDDTIEPVLLTPDDEKSGFLQTVEKTGVPV